MKTVDRRLRAIEANRDLNGAQPDHVAQDQNLSLCGR
jgi:hypothetical protein